MSLIKRLRQRITIMVVLAGVIAILGLLTTATAQANHGGGGGGTGTGGNECDAILLQLDENGHPVLDENGNTIPVLDEGGNTIPVWQIIEDESQVQGGLFIVPKGEKWCIGALTKTKDFPFLPKSTTLKFNIIVFGELGIGANNRVVALDGNVNVENGGKLTVRNTILGNIIAEGTAKVDLPFKARVFGNVVHNGGSPKGSIDFKGNKTGGGAIVKGNVILNGRAVLKASKISDGNIVEGSILCDDDSKVAGGTATNWDGKGGASGEKDGDIGKHYNCAA